jgi:spermidine synthase
VPADDDRFRVIRADGAAYVRHLSTRKDVIVADACDHVGIAPELNEPGFYRNGYEALVPGGILVANICGNEHEKAAHVLKIRQVFGDGQCLTSEFVVIHASSTTTAIPARPAMPSQNAGVRNAYFFLQMRAKS